MNLFNRSDWIKVTLLIFLLLLGAGSLLYNNYLVGKILTQERKSVELWAKAIEFNALPVHQQSSIALLRAAVELQNYPQVPDSLISVILESESKRSSVNFVTDELILDEANNFQIPAVLVDSNDIPLEYSYPTLDSTINGSSTVAIEYGFKNVPLHQIDTPEKRAQLVEQLKASNPPIKIVVGDENTRIAQFVYYGESPTVRILRFFPYVQILILSLLLGIGYTTYRTIKRTEQSNLWVGMAKEAAHQLGTPISSLYGWIHLFKEEYSEDAEARQLITEIENDVERLKRVAERFGKIGSSPELTVHSIEPILEEVVSYLEKRLPQLGKGVEVRKELQARSQVNINPELFQWAVENMVKNSMDALRKATSNPIILIKSYDTGDMLCIDIIDTGAGIDPKNAKNVFKPGFSTKKRGWGLGLSLTKRIIEEYHEGKVFVHQTEPGKGTTMRIQLTVNSN